MQVRSLATKGGKTDRQTQLISSGSSITGRSTAAGGGRRRTSSAWGMMTMGIEASRRWRSCHHVVSRLVTLLRYQANRIRRHSPYWLCCGSRGDDVWQFLQSILLLRDRCPLLTTFHYCTFGSDIFTHRFFPRSACPSIRIKRTERKEGN